MRVIINDKIDSQRGIEPAKLKVDHYVISGNSREGAVLGPVSLASGETTEEFTLESGNWTIEAEAIAIHDGENYSIGGGKKEWNPHHYGAGAKRLADFAGDGTRRGGE